MVGRCGSGADHLGAGQGVDQGALAGPGAAEGCHNQGGFQAESQGGRPRGQPPHQGLAALGGRPVGGRFRPTAEPLDQGVDLGQQLQVGQFAHCHAYRIERTPPGSQSPACPPRRRAYTEGVGDCPDFRGEARENGTVP